jgi:CheY-like chemotaxis protein
MNALLANFDIDFEAIMAQPLAGLATDGVRSLILVDDDPVILNSLKKQAEKFYEKIYCFDSAERARLFITNTEIKFDTALIDYFLPGESGNEIVGSLKMKDGAKIYMMTGDLASVPLQDVKDFDACLPKPIRSGIIKKIFSK